jgi:hypothetical protein
MINGEKSYETQTLFIELNLVQEVHLSNYVDSRMTFACLFVIKQQLIMIKNKCGFKQNNGVYGEKFYEIRTSFPELTLCNMSRLLAKLVLEWQLYVLLL